MSQIQVPNGWKKYENLSEAIDVLESGKRPKGGVDGIKEGIPSLGGEHLNYNGKFNFQNIKFVPIEFFNNLTRGIIKKDDILVVKDGATTGKTSFVDKTFPYEKACVNEHVFLIRPNQALIPKYLYYYIRSNFGQKYILEKKKGDIGGINTSFINNFPIIFPEDKQIQKKIVQKLDYLLQLIDEKQIKIEILQKKQIPSKLLEHSEQYLLSQAFSGNLTETWRSKHKVEPSINLLRKIQKKYRKRILHGKSKKNTEIKILGQNEIINTWTDVKLENLIYISGRIGWKGLKHSEYTESGPLFLSVHSLNYGDIVDYGKAYHIPKWRYDESPEIQLQENDILLAKDGAGIGKIGIVKNLKQPATVNSSLLVIRSGEAFLPDFLFYYLKGPHMQKIAQGRITGSATPHLFQKDIKQFTLSVPPISEQKEIVRVLKNKLKDLRRYESKINDITTAQITLVKNLENIKRSLLHSAFSGKLVN